MKAVIFRPAKTAMQSGQAGTRSWIVEFDPEAARKVEPLMGWTSSDDTRQQLQLKFESSEAAAAFCDRHGVAYEVRGPHARRVGPKAYADNFSYYHQRGPGSEPLPRP